MGPPWWDGNNFWLFKVYKETKGSIGDFEFDAFISYGTSPDFDAGSEEDPEESFVRRLIEDLELGEGDIK